MRKKGAKSKIRAYFESHVGEIVTTDEISKVAGIRDYQRRIRELRNEEGMRILSHIDRHDLRPGQYVLETLSRSPAFGRGMSPQRRMVILERNGFTCQLCGAGPGDVDPFDGNRSVRLHIDHVAPISQGGTDDPSNLRVVCSACNSGRSNVETPSETALNLIARIRKVPRAVQREVYEVLKRSIGD
jgi:5-methylcytosine-specific restriction endonuclease McrA